MIKVTSKQNEYLLNLESGPKTKKDWRVAMGIDWMTRSEIKEAIPPAYTEYIGQYLRTMRDR